LFPQCRRAACGPRPSRRRSAGRDRKARLARARKRNRTERPVNNEIRRVRQARKDEIEARRFRNHMRRMLFLFKGKPSTSPFCQWVNEPPNRKNSHPTGNHHHNPPPQADEPPF
jgi:hypothetical protein